MQGDRGDDVAQRDRTDGNSTGRVERVRHCGDLLLHPVAVAALVVLVFNDHVAKGRWPSEFTGKASDIAGLVFFPLLLVSAAEAIRWVLHRDHWWLGRGALAVAIVITAVGFTAIKTWAPASDAYRVADGVARWPLDVVLALTRGEGFPHAGTVKLVEDRTDLFAIVSLVVPWWIGAQVLTASPRWWAWTQRGRERHRG